eukprot:CAMPEP_0116925956 /NCGR_PEP_ID=MMETSP0467-20121206/24433_1 /TAXON_ID=283647 /ORGANISM="Mesodinium pulex, Strain SPMC105" /LENGTH=53 /DNA_ID=CAMNT_0004605111 /DNA_START=889 /DNA_END=1050 /DNA_ORIENTATION=-
MSGHIAHYDEVDRLFKDKFNIGGDILQNIGHYGQELDANRCSDSDSFEEGGTN